MRGIRIPALATAILAALMLPVTLVSPASAAAPTVDVRPLPLPVGESPTVPYLHRPTEASVSVVDPTNGMKTPVDLVGDENDQFTLLGRSGSGFVLRATNRNIDKVIRVQLDVPQKTLTDMYYADKARLSADGRYLLKTATQTSGAIQAQVRSATTGAVVARHTFKASTRPDPIDVSGTRVLVGGYSTPRTMTWDWKTGTIKTIASRAAYAGSFATNRLATYTKDPSNLDACSVVSTVTAPATTLWRGCLEAVASFSPDGARFATNAIEHQNHADVVRRRSLHGTLLTTYRNPNGLWMYAWETNTRVLMRSYPGNSSGGWLVLCEVADCERAWRAYS
ncbi:hypothetical protein SAMN05428985_106462 [Nocardioides sp. YR527]|uniref:hypothetical protein n=1 Tax=Nocardioides sp. YR527 TaxID=1881028 RepID=UPI000889115F|nr:hypothetical protein [Nocardioides sp. YR527]SDK87144.1 hypothetical protein SAMN05428985_106462 [Nocardioides sp. YR527]